MLINRLERIGVVHVFEDDEDDFNSDPRGNRLVDTPASRPRGRPRGFTSKIGQEHELSWHRLRYRDDSRRRNQRSVRGMLKGDVKYRFVIDCASLTA